MTDKFVIMKYKPLFRLHLKRSMYNQSNIYELMFDRGYSVFTELDVEGEKISNYTKYVDKYLEELDEKSNGSKVQFKDNLTNYIYVWYVRYPRQLLDVKTLIIFRKPIIVNHIHDLTDVVDDGRY